MGNHWDAVLDQELSDPQDHWVQHIVEMQKLVIEIIYEAVSNELHL